MAAADSAYCSPHCETVKSGSEIVCQCGHPQCSGTMKWRAEELSGISRVGFIVAACPSSSPR